MATSSMLRLAALGVLLALAAAQGPLFGLPMPQEMKEMLEQVGSVEEESQQEGSPAALFEKLFNDEEPAQPRAAEPRKPRLVVRALPARVRVVQLPSLSGLLRRLGGPTMQLSELPQPAQSPCCDGFAISRPLKMLRELGSAMPSRSSMGGGLSKSISISSDGQKTVRTETTFNQDGTETTTRTVTRGAGGAGGMDQGLGGMLSMMDMPDELQQLFGDLPQKPAAQRRAAPPQVQALKAQPQEQPKEQEEEPRREAPISQAEAKAAVQKALAEETTDGKASIKVADADKMSKQDRKGFAANIAKTLGLKDGDVKVSVKGQKKAEHSEKLAQVAAVEEPKQEDEADMAQELAEEVEDEKEEADLKDREADTRAAVQSELAKSKKAVLEAKDDKERAEEEVRSAVKEVRVKKGAMNRLQALQQQLQDSVVN